MFRGILKANISCTNIFINDFKRHFGKNVCALNGGVFYQKKVSSGIEYSPADARRIQKCSSHSAASKVNTNVASPQPFTLVSKEEGREFMSIFPDIVRDLTDAGRHTDIPEITKRFAKVLQYNIPTGKKTRGLVVVAAYKMIESPERLTPENIRLANILGWCVEMLQGFFLVIDDIMDAAEIRRGLQCWYARDEVGLHAINDSISIESGIYLILRKYFSQHPSYVQILELFHDVTLKTSLGQALDGLAVINGKPQLDNFTMNRYKAITKYKSGYYSFQLPVALAMYLARKHDPEMHRQAETILLEMGHFFQVQDDYLDSFGNDEVTGKTGVDVRMGKCTWLVVVALQRATPAQRQILEENYGKPQKECQEAVRKLYVELGLPNTYAIYEEESFNLIRTHIQQMSKGLPHTIFLKFMEKIYKREC